MERQHDDRPARGRPRHVRRGVRPAGRRPVVGSGPGQPDRRAHGLQRRLRAAVRDRPPHDRRRRRPRGHARRGSAAPSPTSSSRSTSPSCGPEPWAAGPHIRWASRGRSVDRVRTSQRCPASTSSSTRRCRSGAGLSSSAAIESSVALALNDIWHLGLDRGELARSGQLRRERRGRCTHRHHGPVRVAAGSPRLGGVPRLPFPRGRDRPARVRGGRARTARHRHRGESLARDRRICRTPRILRGRCAEHSA